MKICIAIIAVGIMTCFTKTGLAQSGGRKPIQTIIIDPGHGGLDPGAPGTKSTEAQVSLAVSLKLGDTIAKAWPDLKLIYTRTTDVLPGNKPNKDAALKYRADLANQSGGDLFIAVHCNSAGRHAGGWYEKRVIGKIPHTKTVKKGKKTYKKTYYEYQYENVWVENKVKGTETYVMRYANKRYLKVDEAHGDEDAELIEAHYTQSDDMVDVKNNFLTALDQRPNLYQSVMLAGLVEKYFRTATPLKSRGVRQENYSVLRDTNMPSILVEMGFLSNVEDEKYLHSDQGKQEIATAIFHAIRDYKKSMETKRVIK